jgi:hypothetical protein
MKQILISLSNKNPMLTKLGFGMFFLFFAELIISFFDQRMINGVNIWINPMKFSLSVWMYAWTLVYILSFINDIKKVRLINWLVLLSMLFEILLMLIQTYRGEKSHYNLSTPLNANIFFAMIGAITVNTIAVTILSYWYFTVPVHISPVLKWGIRFGLLLFVLFSLEGYVMGAMLKHSVGTKDSAGGLIFLNWNVNAGDLRVSHFIGLHGLQIIPLFAFIAEYYFTKLKKSYVLMLVYLFSAIYLFVSILALCRALMGKPLLFG